MATACDANSIAEVAKCYAWPCMSEQERLAIAVVFYAWILKDAGGTDFTADFDALVVASVSLQIFNHNEYSAEDLAVDLPVAAAAGAPDNPDDLLEAIKCLRCLSLEALRQALLFLRCSIAAI